MKKKEISQVKDEEIKLWENRVFFPQEAFRENTPADLGLLKSKVVNASIDDKTLILASETEAVIYKTGRHLVELGVRNEDITFLDGDMFDTYVDIESRYKWQSRKLIDELLDSISREIAKKWVIIPELGCEWTKEIALYFIMKIEKIKPYGIIFYSNTNSLSNLAQVLVEETHMDIFQFPKARYSPKKEKNLPNDDY